MLNPSDTKKVRYEARYTKHEGLAEGHKQAYATCKHNQESKSLQTQVVVP